MIFAWIILSFVAAFIGANRTSGFWGTLIASLVLSPLVGFIIAMASRPVAQVEHERVIRAQQQAANDALQRIAVPASAPKSIGEELAQLKALLDQGAITRTQYDAAVAKVTGTT